MAEPAARPLLEGGRLRAVAEGVCCKDAATAVEMNLPLLCQPFTCTTNLSFKYLVYKITISQRVVYPLFCAFVSMQGNQIN